MAQWIRHPPTVYHGGALRHSPKTLWCLSELVYCVSGRFSVRARARSFCACDRAPATWNAGGGRAHAPGHFAPATWNARRARGRVRQVILRQRPGTRGGRVGACARSFCACDRAPATWSARRRAGACARSFCACDVERAAGARARAPGHFAPATWNARRARGRVRQVILRLRHRASHMERGRQAGACARSFCACDRAPAM